jgi:two-component system chemotaxis response regulator CheB
MSQAVVVRRRAAGSSDRPLPLPAMPADAAIVVIGCSAGAPNVLYEVLGQLQAPYSLPIVVAQHIVPGFEEGFAAWLGKTGHRVAVVRDGDAIVPGVVHLARADKDLAVRRRSFELLAADPSRVAPSVDVLFSTTAEAFGDRAIALLLSGMGEDGARGMLVLRRVGALTATQSGASCIIDGMPAAARALGASGHELSPREMAGLLAVLRGRG